ncbi:NAD(P)H-hydrate dehydratase [Bordetella bronchiseptica]|uniref:NAD(P)H-hydrate dehydratase n=1 Tax=Bordetella bronchiseptica TaxID=518 RepID=UPI00049EB174|nr:NAD(P)H-hydrate dehydratase [Bordetella bronchiseptica]KDC72492.1 YjeF family C-terminal domain protein [Bordetella bronchiseptica MBORD632]
MDTSSSSLPAIERQHLPALFAARPTDAHKGNCGTLGVIGGGPGMVGAALLAARAGLKVGAGKVLVGLVAETPPLPCDPMQPELMLRDFRGLLEAGLGIDAWTAGCGCGMDALAANALSELFQLRGDAALVLDADGLNLLAAGAVQPRWGDAPVVLTPHPAEAGRLLGLSTEAVQADRPAAARTLAARYGAWVVLKGAGSIVCDPAGACRINRTGNPGLATAGTGDVLAGILGALLAQRIAPEQAVPGAVWLHGAAADALVTHGIGPIGLTAGELADSARRLRNSRA